MKKQEVKYTDELLRMKRIEGQIQGIQKMILDNRYCPEILQQIKAAVSALKAVETSILKNHLMTCIKESSSSDKEKQFDKKLKELLNLIKT